MRQCPRCRRWHNATDTTVCTVCWDQIGQMQFFQDEDEVIITDPLLFDGEVRVVGLDPDGEDHWPPVDTVFDREEEARGYQ